MIPADEALRLPNALISKADIEICREMLKKLHQHIRTHMTFVGPPPFEVSFRQMSKTAAQLLCYAMKRFKWNVNANLIAEAPRFQGGEPVPHHWVLQLQPMVDAYDEVLSETLTALSEETLDA